MPEPPEASELRFSSFGEVDPRLRDMDRELRSMPGREVLLVLNDLDSSAQVFVDNYHELRKYLQYVQTNPGYIFLGLDQARKQQMEDVFAETRRLVHNFLAASFTLVDHSRCTRDRITPALSDAYQVESGRRFTSDGVAQFWQGLRNFQTHYRPIPLHIVGRAFPPYPPDPPSRALMMRRAELLEWDNWTSAAKAWLRENDDDIDVLDTSTNYFEKVKDFQLWFLEQMRQTRELDLAAFLKREEEYHLLYVETRLDAWLTNPDAGPLDDRALFLHIFDLEDFKALEAMRPASPQRTETALAILRRHFHVPAPLADKFVRAYSDRRFFR